MSVGQGRRAALLTLATLPALAVHADSIEDIAKRNAEAAAAAKSPEALAAKQKAEDDEANGAVLASAAITILLAGSTALSMAPVSENVSIIYGDMHAPALAACESLPGPSIPLRLLVPCARTKYVRSQL